VIDSGNGDRGKLQYDNDFWQFSLAVYGEADVAKECLALQEAVGLDVNLLLFCAWIGRQGIVLSTADIEAALRKVAAWQDHVVGPLRTARQQIKALGYDEFEGFRARIKSVEIDAEQIEHAMLFAYSRSIQNRRAGDDRRNAVTKNIKKYIEMIPGATRPDTPAPVLIDTALRWCS
jgi:uncharacterized protein (TIGR02444 family)